MVRISVDGETVTVQVLGWHAFWGCRRRIAVPRAAIRAVRPARDAGFTRPQGFHMPGTYIPGLIAAGTFCGRQTIFWSVRYLDQAVAIELAGQPWSHLVVEVADPAATLHQFSGAVAQVGASATS